MSVCRVCFDLEPGSEGGKVNWGLEIVNSAFEYHLNFDAGEMDSAAKTGCPNCSVIQHGLRLMQDQYPFLKHIIETEQRRKLILRRGCPLQVELKKFLRFDYFSKTGLCHNFESKSLRREAFGIAKEISPSTSIEKCTSIIKRWIADCDDGHELCHIKVASDEYLPTRLLDISKRVDNLVVLVETHATKRNRFGHTITRYATLSHCWGEVQFLQTERESLAKHKQGIPLDDLPKTFKDSIRILRALNICYLWIDSLCIVQDNKLDWEKESARMSEIYSHSYLNIAATSARDSTGGCLHTRSLKQGSFQFSTQSFPIVNDHGSFDWRIHIRPSYEIVHHRYNKHFGSDPNPSDKEVTPLLCRAWVLQERQLAPRTIHFHQSELVMECKTGLRCECTVLDRRQKKTFTLGKMQDSTDLETYQIYAKWYELVKEYSQLSITRHSDRLTALIGLASQFQERVECGFLAGLWDLDICKGLMWGITRSKRLRGKMNLMRAEKPFAPSWSWASLIPGPDSPDPSITFPYDQTLTPHEKFRYLCTDIPKAAGGWHLMLGTGYIRVTALMIPAIIYNERRGPSRSMQTQLLFKSSPDRQFQCNPTRRYRVKIDVTQARVPSAYYGTMNGTAIHCLIVATGMQFNMKRDKKTAWLYVLLCKQCVNESEEVECERIGVFMILKNEIPLECAEEMTIKLV